MVFMGFYVQDKPTLHSSWTSSGMFRILILGLTKALLHYSLMLMLGLPSIDTFLDKQEYWDTGDS